MADRTSPIAGAVIVASAAAMFGMLAPVTRFSYALGLAPFAFITWRSMVGMVAAGGVMGTRISRERRAVAGGADLAPRGHTGPRAVAALTAAGLGGFLVNIGMFIAFQRIPVALVLLTFYTYPALVAIVAVVLGRERMNRTKALALLLASAGAVGVVASGSGVGGLAQLDALGIGLALMAALGQTVFVTVSREGFPTIRTDEAMTFVLALIAVLGAGTAVAVGTGDSLALPFAKPELLALLVFAGLFTAAIPSLLLLVGIRRLGGMRAGILMLIEPLVGVILAALLLSEPIAPAQLIGGLAILAAAVLLTRAPLDAMDAVAQAVP